MRTLSPDESLVFALDADTQQLRHVREGRTGRLCNCVCPGCGEGLEAVNAQSRVYKHRPHFRHFEGRDRKSCAMSSIRVALAQALSAPGAISLPLILRGPDLIPVEMAGTSSLAFESVSINDFTDAVLRLPDGRELRVSVEVRDTRAVDESGQCDLVLFLPPAQLDLIQSLGDLRRYLTLDPSAWRWCRRQTQPSLLDERPMADDRPLLSAEFDLEPFRLFRKGGDLQSFTAQDAESLSAPTRDGARKLPERRMQNADGSVTVFHRWRLPNGIMSEETEILWP